MKKRLVQTISQGDNTLGQVSHPDDLMKSQDYIHERLSGTIHDFVNNTREYEITGFPYALGAGNAFDITISRPGRVYTKNGISYDQLDDVTLDFAAADDDLPRYDLVVAVIKDDADAELDLIPFQRLRTTGEFSAGTPPYPPANISVATEKHWRAVPQIKTGTPAENPALPAVNSNEIPLYLVAIGAGVTKISDGDVTDLREIPATLRRLGDLAVQNKIDISSMLIRMSKLEDIAGQPVDMSQVYGQIRTLGEILADLDLRTRSSTDLPEIRYDRERYATTSLKSSQINGIGRVINGEQFIDIEVGARINFGSTEHAVEPRNFVDQTLNPHYVTAPGSPAEHEQRAVNLTIETVTALGTHGSVDFLERAAVIGTRRTRPGCAARDERYIEIFGGLSVDNATALGDWMTYDIENDTLTPKMPSGAALPSADRPCMIPYGDGTNVLLIAGSSSTSTPQAFRIDADGVNPVVTAIATTKPTGVHFFGDLIADNKMFIVAVRKVGSDYVTDFWEYDTTSHQFTQLGVTGSVPAVLHPDYAGGCYFRNNQFVMVTFDPVASGTGRTFIFDRTTAQWIELNIPQPYGYHIEKQLQLLGFRMAHVNGRPLIVGGDVATVTFEGRIMDDIDRPAKVWELINKPASQLAARPHVALAWISSNVSFPKMQELGFCSTIGASGLPGSKAFLIAGFTGVRKATSKIYASVQSGLIAATHNGLNGVSIAENSKSVQFEIPMYEANWEVAAYLANLDGRFTSADVSLETTFDDGAHWYQIVPGATFTVPESSDPAERRVRFTLYNNGTNRPILTRLIESLDSEGGVEVEERTMLRIDNRGDGKYVMYMYRDGRITFETALDYSTPEKCLILQTNYELGTPPSVRQFINRRRPFYKVYGGAGAGQELVTCDLAVPVRFVEAQGVVASGKHLYRATIDEEADFLAAPVEVTGLTTGDDYEVLFVG